MMKKEHQASVSGRSNLGKASEGPACSRELRFCSHECTRGATLEGTVWNEGTTRKGCIDSMKLSARNTLKGTITAIHPGAVNAIVIMELEGGQLITSTISMGSIKELELEVGKEAYAIVKASSVIIGVDD